MSDTLKLKLQASGINRKKQLLIQWCLTVSRTKAQFTCISFVSVIYYKIQQGCALSDNILWRNKALILLNFPLFENIKSLHSLSFRGRSTSILWSEYARISVSRAQADSCVSWCGQRVTYENTSKFPSKSLQSAMPTFKTARLSWWPGLICDGAITNI